LSATWETEAARDGTAHGLLLWFDTELTPAIGLSNAPTAPPALYGQAFFPFAPALKLQRGQRVTVELRAVLTGHDYGWSWSATSDGRTTRHATLLGIPISSEALAQRTASFAPHRSTDAEILLALIERVNGHTSLGELAEVLSERFNARFPTADSALGYVTQLEDLWARGGPSGSA